MTFLILGLGLEAALGVWADEMQLYKSCEVGAEYVWGLTDMRTIRVDDGRGERGGMMFLAAMFNFDVAPVTLPIHQPLTVLGYWIEWWARNLIIPWMVLRGKKFIVFDNARVHRRQFLRPLFRAAGIEVYFLPAYSPWFQPIDKMFLSTHKKCSQRVNYTRAFFTYAARDRCFACAHRPRMCGMCSANGVDVVLVY